MSVCSRCDCSVARSWRVRVVLCRFCRVHAHATCPHCAASLRRHVRA